MTVALKLTLSAWLSPSPSVPAGTSSPLSELLFQPQLWLTLKSSGALVNRVRLPPVALAHAMAKYAFTNGRGSRYGCCGAAAGAVAGSMSGAEDTDASMLLLLLEGREEASPGEGIETGVVLRESGRMGRPEDE